LPPLMVNCDTDVHAHILDKYSRGYWGN